MNIALSQILALVGKLDDTPGQETPRERFRNFLKHNVTTVGHVRDYIEECLRNSGDQYSRALQDLVNHLGHFLGFQVTFGRYTGTAREVGFDGHWVSAEGEGFHIVIEVKTTGVYAVKTSTLVSYIDHLISERKIPDWDHALGLYVIGRPDPELSQLENAIVAEKRTNQLRTISVQSLLSLAELMAEYDVKHKDVLAILLPSGPSVDRVANLMAELVAQRQVKEAISEDMPFVVTELREGQIEYWLAPVKDDEERTAEEAINFLVGKEKIWALGERTPGKKYLKPGDYICFYAAGKGVMAHAEVDTAPERKPHPAVYDSDNYPWTFRLKNIQLYLNDPIVVDASLRSQLDAFKDWDPAKNWAWFVQVTRRINRHDFEVLTGQGR